MKNYLFLSILIPFILSCNTQSSELSEILKTYDVNSKNACDSKEGYWYKDKCWANFDGIDEGISIADIDTIAQEQYNIIKKTKIEVNGIKHQISLFFPSEEDDGLTFITIFNQNGVEKTLFQEAEDASIFSKKDFKKKVRASAILVDGNIFEMSEAERETLGREMKNPSVAGEIEVIINDADELDISFNGVLKVTKTGEEYTISYRSNSVIMGAGTSSLVIKGNEAYLNGVLGTITYIQMKDIIKNHPNVKTIVLEHVPGSMNDAVNMHTGRLVREAGLNTRVMSSSDIASGGVDLFCSGKERIVAEGAKIGVHSWGGGAYTAIELPQDHPAHLYQIEYFTMCLGNEMGPAFYFYTLEAAPFDGVHYMEGDEIKRWELATI